MKILMVCLGNICRSPLAEGIMRQLSNNQNLNWKIASAGTGHWHVGEPPHHKGIEIAKTFGYDISKQRAQHFNATMFASYDLIFVMDKNNLKDVLNIAKTNEDRNKVKLFLNNDDVEDPYYDNDLFGPVCKQIEERCNEIISQYS